MNEPKPTHLVDNPKDQVKRSYVYAPLDPTSVRDYARAVCTELAQQNPAYCRSEVISGFTVFLSFVAERMAKYLNSEHKEYLLKGYRKPTTLSR